MVVSIPVNQVLGKTDRGEQALTYTISLVDKMISAMDKQFRAD